MTRPNNEVCKADSDHIQVMLVESDLTFSKKVDALFHGAALPDHVATFKIDHAMSLREAVDQLVSNSYDVILTDVNLQDANGFLVLEELLEFGHQAPIIVLSNIRNWSMMFQSAHVGASDFLLKQSLNEDILMRSIFYAIERKKVELRFQRSQHSYQSLIEILPTGLFLCNRDGVLEYVNKPITKLFGLQTGQMVGKNIRELNTSAMVKEFQKVIEQTFRNGRGIEREFSVSGDDPGYLRTYLGLTAPVKDVKGDIDSVQCILWDITENRKIQKTRESSKMLATLQSSLSSISNELNNALTPILLDAEILESLPELKEHQKITERIGSSVRIARSILRPFLLSVDHLSPRTEQLDPHKLILGYAEEIKKQHPKGIRYEFQIADHLHGVLEADSALIHTMLDHMVQNAIEAMAEGGVLLIRARSTIVESDTEAYDSLQLKPGTYLHITIADEGHGIENENRERIFEPFYTEKNDTHRGLGLTETLTIVRNYDGAIKHGPRSGGGTEFEVYLPLKLQGKAEVMEETTKISPSCKKTILFVDDEENIKRSVEILLGNRGYKVIFASNGAEGLAVFKQYQAEIGLVITDVVMPVMDGKTLVESIRAMSPSTKIIFCAGIEMKTSIEKVADLHVADTLYKPFTGKALREKIQQNLS
ncbi:MAG: response regulator [Verrucomicrobiota bacterium]